jgi:hypothetical protein
MKFGGQGYVSSSTAVMEATTPDCAVFPVRLASAPTAQSRMHQRPRWSHHRDALLPLLPRNRQAQAATAAALVPFAVFFPCARVDFLVRRGFEEDPAETGAASTARPAPQRTGTTGQTSAHRGNNTGTAKGACKRLRRCVLPVRGDSAPRWLGGSVASAAAEHAERQSRTEQIPRTLGRRAAMGLTQGTVRWSEQDCLCATTAVAHRGALLCDINLLRAALLCSDLSSHAPVPCRATVCRPF